MTLLCDRHGGHPVLLAFVGVAIWVSFFLTGSYIHTDPPSLPPPTRFLPLSPFVSSRSSSFIDDRPTIRHGKCTTKQEDAQNGWWVFKRGNL